MYNFFYKEKNRELEKRNDFVPGAWIDCFDLSIDEERNISEKFNIDIGLLEDSKDIYEVSRLEKEEGVFSIFLRYPAPKENEYNLATLPFLVAISKDYILTSYGKLVDEPFFVKILKNNDNKNLSTKNKKDFLIFVLNLINKKYENGFRKISREVLAQKSHISKISDKELERFVELETVVNEFLSALIPMSEELGKILKNDKFLVTTEIEWDEFEDIILAQKQLIDNGKNILKMIQNIRDAFSIIATNRLNKTVTKLTILTLVLTIPTIISSFFGMNMPNLFENNENAFFWVVLFGLSLPVIIYLIFVKNISGK